MKKEDLRIRKTKHSIKESFIDLVKKKGYKKVSVTDIVKEANINRNTFYLHYEDKEDLIKKLILENTNKIKNKIGSSTLLEKTTFFNISEFQIRWGLRSILNIMEEELEFYKICLSDEGLSGFVEQVFDLIKDALSKVLDVNNPQSNLVFEYTMSGVFGLVKQWIKYANTSTGETAKILAQLSYAGLTKFKTINY